MAIAIGLHFMTVKEKEPQQGIPYLFIISIHLNNKITQLSSLFVRNNKI
jgi:hypothetical protein